MSVFMTLELSGDPKRLEQYAAENKDAMASVLAAAKQAGLIAHRFYGSEDGSRILVLDQWPDRRSFEGFFQSQGETIGAMMQAAGVTGEPSPAFWSELDTHDKFGWGA